MNLRTILTLTAIIAAVWTLTASAAPGTCNGQRQRARLRDGSCLGVPAPTNRWCGRPNCPGPRQCPNWDPSKPCPRLQQCPRGGCCWVR